MKEVEKNLNMLWKDDCMHLYFVRHGQTEFNKKKIIQGGTVNSNLTEQGVEGAKRAGKYLADIPFAAAYSSPQQRALDTASYILEENHFPTPVIKTDRRLREIEFGSYDGRTIAEFKEDGYYDIFRDTPQSYSGKEIGGEDYQQVTDRAMAALSNIVNQANEDDHILIVAHSITLTSLVKHLQNIPVSDYRKDGVLDNTSITCFDYHNGCYQLEYYNYVPK